MSSSYSKTGHPTNRTVVKSGFSLTHTLPANGFVDKLRGIHLEEVYYLVETNIRRRLKLEHRLDLIRLECLVMAH